MNYGPGNIPNTMGSDSSTSGQAPLLLPFFFHYYCPVNISMDLGIVV